MARQSTKRNGGNDIASLGGATAPKATAAKPAATVSPSAAGGTATLKRPTTEQIRLRAYMIYKARKGAGGTPETDWAQAERELTAELNRH